MQESANDFLVELQEVGGNNWWNCKRVIIGGIVNRDQR